MGLGEISPVKEVHSETLAKAKEQIKEIQDTFLNLILKLK